MRQLRTRPKVLVLKETVSLVTHYRVPMASTDLPATLEDAVVLRWLGMRVLVLPRESIAPSTDLPLQKKAAPAATHS